MPESFSFEPGELLPPASRLPWPPPVSPVPLPPPLADGLFAEPFPFLPPPVAPVLALPLPPPPLVDEGLPPPWRLDWLGGPPVADGGASEYW